MKQTTLDMFLFVVAYYAFLARSPSKTRIRLLHWPKTNRNYHSLIFREYTGSPRFLCVWTVIWLKSWNCFCFISSSAIGAVFYCFFLSPYFGLGLERHKIDIFCWNVYFVTYLEVPLMYFYVKVDTCTFISWLQYSTCIYMIYSVVFFILMNRCIWWRNCDVDIT